MLGPGNRNGIAGGGSNGRNGLIALEKAEGDIVDTTGRTIVDRGIVAPHNDKFPLAVGRNIYQLGEMSPRGLAVEAGAVVETNPSIGDSRAEAIRGAGARGAETWGKGGGVGDEEHTQKVVVRFARGTPVVGDTVCTAIEGTERTGCIDECIARRIGVGGAAVVADVKSHEAIDMGCGIDNPLVVL